MRVNYIVYDKVVNPLFRFSRGPDQGGSARFDWYKSAYVNLRHDSFNNTTIIRKEFELVYNLTHAKIGNYDRPVHTEESFAGFGLLDSDGNII